MEDLLQAKVISRQLHTQQYHTQANAHHQELHDTESKGAFARRVFVSERAQPCPRNLAICEQSFRFVDTGYLAPVDQNPTC